jgi:hypothetical protein
VLSETIVKALANEKKKAVDLTGNETTAGDEGRITHQQHEAM